MGNLYRFVEPVVLYLLHVQGESHGYSIAQELQHHALTDAEIERGALYRTLNQLEANGHVTSRWETSGGGPARRLYRLTPSGEEHLREWAEVLGHMSRAMAELVGKVKALDGEPIIGPKE